MYNIMHAAAVWGQAADLVECYTDNNCLSQTTLLLMTRRECCVDTPEAVSFKVEGDETCDICTGMCTPISYDVIMMVCMIKTSIQD